MGALQHWIESTVALGWIDESKVPTEVGSVLATQLELATQPAGRAYAWPQASELERKARCKALLDKGDRVAAVKLYRSETQASLPVAMEAFGLK